MNRYDESAQNVSNELKKFSSIQSAIAGVEQGKIGVAHFGKFCIAKPSLVKEMSLIDILLGRKMMDMVEIRHIPESLELKELKKEANKLKESIRKLMKTVDPD